MRLLRQKTWTYAEASSLACRISRLAMSRISDSVRVSIATVLPSAVTNLTSYPSPSAYANHYLPSNATSQRVGCDKSGVLLVLINDPNRAQFDVAPQWCRDCPVNNVLHPMTREHAFNDYFSSRNPQQVLLEVRRGRCIKTDPPERLCLRSADRMRLTIGWPGPRGPRA